MLLRRIGYNFWPQLRRINVVSIESQNLYKPLTTPGPLKYREWRNKKKLLTSHQPAKARKTRPDPTAISSCIVSGWWNRSDYRESHYLERASDAVWLDYTRPVWLLLAFTFSPDWSGVVVVLGSYQTGLVRR